MINSMENEPIIQVADLTAGYGDEIILEKVTFDVNPGEIFIILGGSGCGKTTLLRHIVGLNSPLAGQVIIDGDDIASGDSATVNNALKKIGILFQGSALFGSMTIEENIALPIAEYSDLSRQAIFDLVRMKLCMVDLSGYGNHFPSEISGGMKKRAGLARALALNPKILFLDEPTAGLDPPTSAEIDELIRHINRTIGTTIVIVTHELDSIFSIAQRVIMLDKETKGIMAEGDPKFLKEHSDIDSVRAFFNRQSRTDQEIRIANGIT